MEEQGGGNLERIMAVLTREPSYAKRLCAYFNRKKELSVTAVACAEARAYADFCEEHPVQILLIDEASLREANAEGNLSLLQAERVIGLREDGADVYRKKKCADSIDKANAEENSEVQLDDAGYGDALMLCDAVIEKYQSADQILRQVMEQCCDLGIRPWRVASEQKKQIIGVFSPLGRCRKTAFALTICRSLSRDHKPLYLNFEPFSGFAELTGETYETGLSDALYYLRQKQLDYTRLASMVYTFSDVDYLPPLRSAEDMGVITGSEFAALLESILKESPYDVIVADLGFFSEAAAEMMELCTQIYMPVRKDFISQAKLREFETYLSVSGKTALTERIYKVGLPEPGCPVQGSTYLDSLLYSAFGDYVRALLHGGKKAEELFDENEWETAERAGNGD